MSGMACSESGKPGDTECSEVLHDVWLFLDNEMDAEQRVKVQAHLDGCSPCLDETDVGQKLKALLQRKCGGEVAPDVLRDKLEAALRSRPTAAADQ